jgi:carbonic anhydrase
MRFAALVIPCTVFLTACASAHKHEEAPKAPPPAASEASAADTKTGAPPSAAEVTKALKPPKGAKPGTESEPESLAAAAPAAKEAAPLAGHAPEGVEPEKALGWLQNGNKRFQKGKGWLRKDGQAKADIKRLTEKQRPHAIILACSDSRVPPEIVFDQKLGEVFVIRTIGEALDENVIGSIEYALTTLGTRLLVVMGHTSCGAVNAAIKTLNGGDAGSPALNHVLNDIRPRIKASFGKETSDDGAVQSIANAKGVAADLMARSPTVRAAVEQGRLTIKSALYEMESGAVKFE